MSLYCVDLRHLRIKAVIPQVWRTQPSSMNTKLKILTRVAAVLSFSLCLAGGLWILNQVGFQEKNDSIWTGLGLYFVGKAFFVGPMLLVAAEQLDPANRTTR